ncbi:site-specific integrase [Dyadobacter sp. CY351]|uniref:tyrosine-type recombinase/integrase n=1 Tax=Dyadobacter sp. CY351 TaxID=2909337 RepID=UPI001F408B23|nr:site-specific integrase [Dyadobacter sp. CY351]MCF2516038.1 site-specific integrase [Dyadobacter sp. CY351]
MAKLRISNLSYNITQAGKHIQNGGRSTRSTFVVSFGLRQVEKMPIDKLGYVYMWLRFGRNRLAFSTGVKASPRNFDQKSAIINGNPEGTMSLTALKHKAEAYASQLQLASLPVDLQLIKASTLGSYIENIPGLLECMKQFNEKVILELFHSGDLEKGSYDKLQVWQRHCIRWISNKFGTNPRIEDIVPADAIQFLLWLKNKYSLSHNVACRIVTHLRRILNYAVENEWITRNPFMNYRKKLERKKRDFLSEDEIGLLQSATFASDALHLSCDLFLFQIYTGLGYRELLDLKPNHISTVDGKFCILIPRQKTNVLQVCPLVPAALALLAKYKGYSVCREYGVCFPVRTNQKYNQHLKQVALVLGIRKRLTTHIARHTAATHYLKAGVPALSVSAMLAHSNVQMTLDHYAHIQPEMVVRDFSRFLGDGSLEAMTKPLKAV